MHRRKWLLVLGGLQLGLILLGVWLYSLDRESHVIRYENFDAIKIGMSAAEVNDLLGCPPGDYRTGEIAFPERKDTVTDLPDFETILAWQGDQGDVFVHLDAEERVVAKVQLRGERVPFLKRWLLRWFER